MNSSYIVGLTEGEGCFCVSLRRDYRIDLRFFIVQAIGNKPLLEEVRKFFGIGIVYQKQAGKGNKLPAYVFEVTKRNDIYQVIIPFFTKNKFLGYKLKSFQAFKEIAKVVQGRLDTRKLNTEELSYVRNLKENMNKHYGSPGAGKPLAGWEHAITSSKA